MANWGNITNKLEPEEIIKPGGGINSYLPPFEIQRNQNVSNLNVSSRHFPSLSVRSGSETAFNSTPSSPIININALGVYNGTYFLTLTGTNFNYYPTSTGAIALSTSLTNASGKILEFNTAATRYTFFTNGTDRYLWNGSTGSAVVSTTQAPTTKLYTLDDFRLYALDGSVIKYCAAGDPTDWTTIDDAGEEAIVGMIGTGTAIAAYSDSVIAWSDQTMHILDGNSPDDFELRDPVPIGNISDRGTIQHASNTGNILYWMDYGRIMAYTGGFPYEVGQAVKTYLDGINYTYKSLIHAFKYKKFVYWSIPYEATTAMNTLTLEYDTEFNTWNIYNCGIIDSVNIGEDLFCAMFLSATTGYYVNAFNGFTDDFGNEISWEAITGIWSHLPARNKKTLSNLYAIVDLSTSSTLTISYSTLIDSPSTSFTALTTVSGSSVEQNIRVQIPTNVLQRVDWYRLKFSGTGQCVIHYIEPYVRINRR